MSANPQQPVTYREFDDVDAMRRNILDNVRKSTASRYPIENERYRMELSDLAYDREEPYSLKKQKEAIMQGTSLRHKLQGTWRLIDKATGDVVDEKRTVVAHVPMMTQRGTTIYNGNEYTCLHPSVQVWTERGMIPIGDIVDQRLDVKVWSWNFAAKSLELKPIVNWFENKTKSTLSCARFYAPGRFSTTATRFSPTTLWATPEHKIYDVNGQSTELRDATKLTVVREKLSYSQGQLLRGTMIGDGTIYDGLYRAIHCEAQLEYLEAKAAILGDLVVVPPTARKASPTPSYGLDTKASAVFRDAASELYVGAGGRKRISKDWLAGIDDLGLAFWFFDDGSARYNGGTNSPTVSLHTNWYEEDEIDVMISWFEQKYGMRPYKVRSEGVYSEVSHGFSLQFNAEDSWRLFEIVAPYAPECMRYKFLPRPAASECRSCGKALDPVKRLCNACLLTDSEDSRGSITKTARYRFGDSATVRVLRDSGVVPEDEFPRLERWLSIQAELGSKLEAVRADCEVSYELIEVDVEIDDSGEQIYAKRRTVYDIEVEGNHNYFANGVLVSNCNNQLRLRSGPYSRRKDNGELETHFNVLPGSGRAFRVHLEPKSGVFKMQVGQSHIPLYPVLRSIGMNDEQLEQAWGADLLKANRINDPRAVQKAYERFVKDKQDGETPEVGLQRAFQSFELDDDIVDANLGTYLKPQTPGFSL